MSLIEFTRDGHVAHVALNRPAALNAINHRMNAELLGAWETINADPSIWVTVLSGNGARAVCAGGDILETGVTPERRIGLGGGLTGLGGPLVRLRTPLIAVVHGYVYGGGLELAMCADIILAADTARFALPEVRAGIMGGAGVMHRVIRQLPHRIAMELILTGDDINAEQALHYGLVNEVVQEASLPAATARWVERLGSVSPLAAQAAKAAVSDGLGRPLEEALSARYEEIDRFAESSDRREAQRAFAEKRPPRWTGA